ncbi:hypothetical protein N9B94_02985 [Verrucomicrobia bacterium]|nr:hypothetical protein [Verrucomicrobiota bacterium]
MNRSVKCLWGSLVLVLALTANASEESDYYKLVTYPVPDDLKLEISGLATLPDGRVAAALRKGEIWIIDQLDPEHPEEIRYQPFAKGLHEPLGLAWHNDSLYTVQRTELTRILDNNGDGTADEFRTIAKGWGVSGSYHEYAYGPVFDKQGNAWLTLNVSMGTRVTSADTWRGWSLKVAPDGTMKPVSGGFRSPSGIGINLEGDLFATDQQGNWFPTCPLVHVREGAFHGHADALKHCALPGATFQIKEPLPNGLTVAEASKQIPAYKLPAVWFPYRKMGMSSTDVLCDSTEGKFGPFAGQLFVGEFTMSFVSRVALEKVKGEYQGACFRFREGLQSATMRMGWDKDGNMIIGQTNRGWNSLGDRSFGLQQLVWTGKTPFEIKIMKLTKGGFRLEFTGPVNAKIARSLKTWKLSSYTYPYQSRYGGEEIDVKQLKVGNAKVSKGGTVVELTVDGLREGYVHELDASELKSDGGAPLLHSEAYYTLNHFR